MGNILESFYKSYTGLSQSEREYWTKYDAIDNGRSLLYGGDNKVVITPLKIQPRHFDNICRIAGWKNVINLFPIKYTGSICEDIINSNNLLDQLIDIIRRNPKIEIIPYRNTPEFYDLIAILKDKGLRFAVPELIEKSNLFVEKYFHSKRGFRHLWSLAIDKKNTIRLPFGFITENKEEAAEAGFWFKQKEKDFVIKFNRGVSGIGLIFCNLKDFSSKFTEFRSKFLKLLTDEIWENTSIVVEEKIEADSKRFGGSPNVEMKVDENGKVYRMYACEQVLSTDHKTFLGVGMNPELEVDPQMESGYDTAEKLGRFLANLGYRGYFDMDMVAGKDTQMYAVEANLRRTGGTHIHNFAGTLLGKDYAKKYYVMSFEIKLDAKRNLKYADIYKILEHLKYDAEKKWGILFTNADTIELGVLSLMTVTKNRKDQARLALQIRDYLEV